MFNQNNNLNPNKGNPLQPNIVQQGQNFQQIDVQDQLLHNNQQIGNIQGMGNPVTSMDRTEVLSKFSMLITKLSPNGPTQELMNFIRNIENSIFNSTQTKQDYLTACGNKLKEIETKLKQNLGQPVLTQQQQNILAQRAQQYQNSNLLRQNLQPGQQQNVNQATLNALLSLNQQNFAGQRPMSQNVIGAMTNQLKLQNNLNQLNSPAQGQPLQNQFPNNLTPQQIAHLQADPNAMNAFIQRNKAMRQNAMLAQLNNININNQVGMNPNFNPNNFVGNNQMQQLMNLKAQNQSAQLSVNPTLAINPILNQAISTQPLSNPQANSENNNTNISIPVNSNHNTLQPNTSLGSLNTAISSQQNQTSIPNQNLTKNTKAASQLTSTPKNIEGNNNQNNSNVVQTDNTGSLQTYTEEQYTEAKDAVQNILKFFPRDKVYPPVTNPTSELREQVKSLIEGNRQLIKLMDKYLPLVYLELKTVEKVGYFIGIQKLFEKQIEDANTIILKPNNIQMILSAKQYLINIIKKYVPQQEYLEVIGNNSTITNNTTSTPTQTSNLTSANTSSVSQQKPIQPSLKNNIKSGPIPQVQNNNKASVNSKDKKPSTPNIQRAENFVQHIPEPQLNLKLPPVLKKPVNPNNDGNEKGIAPQKLESDVQVAKNEKQEVTPGQVKETEIKTKQKTLRETFKNIQVEEEKEDVVMVIDAEQAKKLKERNALRKAKEEEARRQKYSGVLKRNKEKKVDIFDELESTFKKLKEVEPNYKQEFGNINDKIVTNKLHIDFSYLNNDVDILESSNDTKSNPISQELINELVCFPYDFPNAIGI